MQAIVTRVLALERVRDEALAFEHLSDLLVAGEPSAHVSLARKHDEPLKEKTAAVRVSLESEDVQDLGTGLGDGKPHEFFVLFGCQREQSPRLAKGIPSHRRQVDEVNEAQEDWDAEDGVNHAYDHHTNLREDNPQGRGWRRAIKANSANDVPRRGCVQGTAFSNPFAQVPNRKNWLGGLPRKQIDQEVMP
jgi:hypothetical protein